MISNCQLIFRDLVSGRMVIVRFLDGSRLLMVLLALALGCGVASANDVYIAQTAAGAANGADCADARPLSFFNSSPNWGSGTGQIGPATTVHICGTISVSANSYALAFQGS